MDIAESDVKRPEIEARIETISHIVEPNLIAIDHGFDRSKPGYSANAVIVVDSIGEKRVVTVLHNINLNGGTAARVIDPSSPSGSQRMSFMKIENDTAISSHGQYNGNKKGLPVGHFSIGSILSVHGIRHTGGGQFSSAPIIWGTVIGQVIAPDDHQLYWQVTMESGNPQVGDSGSVVVNSEASVVGVFRRLINRTFLFSPIPTSFVAKSSS